MSPENQNQFEDCFRKFLESGTFNYTARAQNGSLSVLTAIEMLKSYTRMYLEKNRLLPSVSAFKIIRDELANERMILPLRKEEGEEEFTLTADEYRQIPVRALQQRYKSDALFRDAVDKLQATGQV
jgi:hypothetical protein